MLDLLFSRLGINEDVVKVDNYEFVEILHEYVVHKMGESWRSIRDTKRHHRVFIESIAGFESCFGDIFLPNPDLMLSHPQIQLGENFGGVQLFEKIIDLRQMIFVFDGLFVERTIVHTKSVSTIFLLYKQSRATT